ncbi:hypothetical protein V499_02641 [Pseudogymnoascus sp. VKM F-103]|nr:hypothetical protein V499_02641 [Pseudogymnoascus sp. VKM F-103]
MQFQYLAVALLSGLAIATPDLQQPEKRVDIVGDVTSAAGGAVSSALGGITSAVGSITGGGSSAQETGASSGSEASSTASSEASSTGSESSSATESSSTGSESSSATESSSTGSESSSATESSSTGSETGASSTGASSTGGAGSSGTSTGGAMRTAAPMAGLLGAAGFMLVFSAPGNRLLFLSLFDVERGGYGAEVDGAVVAADFAADAAGAELVGDGGVAVDGEFDAAALAASFEFPMLQDTFQSVVGSSSVVVENAGNLVVVIDKQCPDDKLVPGTDEY